MKTVIQKGGTTCRYRPLGISDTQHTPSRKPQDHLFGTCCFYSFLKVLTDIILVFDILSSLFDISFLLYLNKPYFKPILMF